MSETRSNRRDQQIVEIARREVDPQCVGQFEPITRGPVVALLGILFVGVVGVFYLAIQKIGSLPAGRRNEHAHGRI